MAKKIGVAHITPVRGTTITNDLANGWPIFSSGSSLLNVTFSTILSSHVCDRYCLTPIVLAYIILRVSPSIIFQQVEKQESGGIATPRRAR